MAERDDRLDSAIESLRELPLVRPEATARLLIAIAAERQRVREAGVAVDRRGLRRWAWAGIATVVAASVGLLLMPPNATRDDRSLARETADRANTSPVIVASHDARGAEAPRAVELVFSAPAARSVRVVGDFNGWNERLTAMVRDDASGLWSARLMLRPGRHVYAFVVNDTQWMRDPRAPAAPDADFGRAGSVLLVGRP